MQLDIILEGYGRTYDFPYQKFSTDPRPRILLLGKYRHPTTGNINIGGINLNYLNDEQIKELRQNLKTVLQPKNLQLRYWRGRRLMPDIFTNAYRTYNTDYVGAVTKDTLTFWPSIGELDQAERAAKEQEMQQYDKAMRTKHKIGRVPKAAPPTPEPALPEVPSVEPEAEPKGPAPATDIELARPETEVPSEPAPGVGKQQEQEPAITQEPAKAGAAGAAAQQPEMETPPAGPVVRGGPGRKGKGAPGAGAPAAAPKEKLTSSQRRRQQAEQIKKATDAAKQAKKKKPEPPDDLRGIMGMFKPPNK